MGLSCREAQRGVLILTAARSPDNCKVPASHGNKYGYGEEAVVVSVSQQRVLIRLDITAEERWHPMALVRKWIRSDVESLGSEFTRLFAQ